MAALRLLHVFDKVDTGNHQGGAFEAGVKTWRNVVNGHADTISPENEDKWRRMLLHMCEHVKERARSCLSAMTALDRDEDETSWQKWMADNVAALWSEECDVAAAVMQSVVSGVEF